MSRNGKIARLPRDIRDQLNRRLQEGEPGEPLLSWLNALPEVQAVLAGQFGGAAINKQNLSEWRTGGFAEWQARRETLADARELAADAAELECATVGRLTDHLATLLAARYASLISRWDGQPTDELRQTLKVLRGLSQDIVALRRGDHSAARLQLEQDWLEEEREKTQEEMVGYFEEWAKKPEVQDLLCQTWDTPQAREQRKRQLFGLPQEEEADESAPAEPEPTEGENSKSKVQNPTPKAHLVRHSEGGSPEPKAESPEPIINGPPPESPADTAPAGSESSPVMPSQTNFEPVRSDQGRFDPSQHLVPAAPRPPQILIRMPPEDLALLPSRWRQSGR